jgi:membrane protein YqaA with SNARE-associated domain
VIYDEGTTASLGAVFASAFLSSTLLPGGSEAVLAMSVAGQWYKPVVLFSVATLGNTLGGMSTWVLGRVLASRRPDGKPGDVRRDRAVERIRRWGSPALLLSWLPVVGDPLCFAAGWVRVDWRATLVFIGIGKGLRYALIVAAAA